MQKGTPSQHKLLRPLVGAWFQGLFHSSIRSAFHLSFTVLVHYRSLGVFSLTGWSRLVHARFLVSRATQDTTTLRSASNTGLSPSMVSFSKEFFSLNVFATTWSYNPNIAVTTLVWANPRFARHYLGNHYYFLFLQVLRCFSSLR